MTKKVTLGLGNSNDRTSTSGHDGLTGTLSLRPFNILIIIVLNSWSDNSNINAMSSSDVCYVSSSCTFCLLVHFISFFLILDMMYWVKETAANRLSVMLW